MLKPGEELTIYLWDTGTPYRQRRPVQQIRFKTTGKVVSYLLFGEDYEDD